MGDPKDQVRNSIRAILRSLRNIYAASKLSNFLMEGSKSKNAKQRAECLDDIVRANIQFSRAFFRPFSFLFQGLIIRDYGINVLQVKKCPPEIKSENKQKQSWFKFAFILHNQPSPPIHLKEMAKLIADRDTSVRNAALNAITEAFFQVSKLYFYLFLCFYLYQILF